MVGVESAFGFGDALFNLPLIKALAEHHNSKVAVAITPQCADAMENIPWIERVVHCGGLHQGVELLKAIGYDPVYQITQNVKFMPFRNADNQHSLIDTPRMTGRELGLPDFDQRPIFLPTKADMLANRHYDDGVPTIAISSVFNSQQSWAGSAQFQAIIKHYRSTHRILWLSHRGAPRDTAIDGMKRWTRRQIIGALQHVETLFSVGSGFFCAALALPERLQPKRIVCMFERGYYLYQDRLNELGWHKNLVWADNHQQLLDHL
jgi:hypothetical protein